MRGVVGEAWEMLEPLPSIGFHAPRPVAAHRCATHNSNPNPTPRPRPRPLTLTLSLILTLTRLSAVREALLADVDKPVR